jgi:hypothetical protein
MRLNESGQRRVFCLLRDAGVLRSVTEFRDDGIVVLSGAHTRYQRDRKSSGGQAIADILLTPGDGFDPDVFAHYLPDAALHARYFSTHP